MFLYLGSVKHPEVCRLRQEDPLSPFLFAIAAEASGSFVGKGQGDQRFRMTSCGLKQVETGWRSLIFHLHTILSYSAQ